MKLKVGLVQQPAVKNDIDGSLELGLWFSDIAKKLSIPAVITTVISHSELLINPVCYPFIRRKS